MRGWGEHGKLLLLVSHLLLFASYQLSVSSGRSIFHRHTFYLITYWVCFLSVQGFHRRNQNCARDPRPLEELHHLQHRCFLAGSVCLALICSCATACNACIFSGNNVYTGCLQLPMFFFIALFTLPPQVYFDQVFQFDIMFCDFFQCFDYFLPKIENHD